MRRQDISVQVVGRLETPQRCSTRALYKAKWTHFVQWYQTNKLDFNSLSIKQIADFLMFLFEERNLQPCTIDDFKTAIVDKVGNSFLDISKDENLTMQRDRSKDAEMFPLEIFSARSTYYASF